MAGGAICVKDVFGGGAMTDDSATLPAAASADDMSRQGMAAAVKPDPVWVDAWSAIMVEDGAEEPNRFGAATDDASIPAAMRRRLGPYARLAVSCGLAVTTPQSDIVYCSRYGDVALASRLLSDLIISSPLSPAAFSLSVHNAVPGVMDLARVSRVGHTAIAAGPDSLSAGFCEAWAKLESAPETNITLIYADYELPTIYSAFSTYACRGIALALSLNKVRSSHSLASLTLNTDKTRGHPIEAPASDRLVQSLIETLQSDQACDFSWISNGLQWSLDVAGHG